MKYLAIFHSDSMSQSGICIKYYICGYLWLYRVICDIGLSMVILGYTVAENLGCRALAPHFRKWGGAVIM